jgi:pimeloyl-ACP methyl ester carboxylesterase
MKKIILPFILFLLNPVAILAQNESFKSYQKVELEGYEFPVLLRGNLSSGVILLFVQGGPGETAIDFARADYPKWKNSLEKEVAIAYFDQRGLNQKPKKVDSNSINYQQYAKDILALGRFLKNAYQTQVFAFGHSAGGTMVLEALRRFPRQSQVFDGAIISNSTMTTDFSPERNTDYRPKYLRNLAQEKIQNEQEIIFWKEASQWIEERESLQTVDDMKKWNFYVDHAFDPSRRKINLGMIFRVLFSPPYNPIRYLNRKDNKQVDDLLWESERGLDGTGEAYSTILVPVLLLTGRFDSTARPEEVMEMAELIPHSNLKIIPNAGHESFLDAPKEFQSLILDFIFSGPF